MTMEDGALILARREDNGLAVARWSEITDEPITHIVLEPDEVNGLYQLLRGIFEPESDVSRAEAPDFTDRERQDMACWDAVRIAKEIDGLDLAIKLIRQEITDRNASATDARADLALNSTRIWLQERRGEAADRLVAVR